MRESWDRELLLRARSGDELALEQLVGNFGAPLLGLVRVRLGQRWRPRIESQDVVQVVLLKALERFGQFDGSSESELLSWLAAIARNELLDQIEYHGRQKRDRRREVVLDSGIQNELVDSVASLLSRIQLSQEQLRLEEAIEALPEDQKTAVELRHYGEMPFAEIATHLGRSEDACRMLVARGMKALTVRLQGA